MNITQVKLTRGDWGKTKAFASITLDSEFVVSGLKVIEGNNGFFVAMPSQKNKNDEYKDVCFPVTKEARQTIQDAVMAEFEDGAEPPQKIDEKKAAEYKDDGLPF